MLALAAMLAFCSRSQAEIASPVAPDRAPFATKQSSARIAFPDRVSPPIHAAPANLAADAQIIWNSLLGAAPAPAAKAPLGRQPKNESERAALLAVLGHPAAIPYVQFGQRYFAEYYAAIRENLENGTIPGYDIDLWPERGIFASLRIAQEESGLSGEAFEESQALADWKEGQTREVEAKTKRILAQALRLLATHFPRAVAIRASSPDKALSASAEESDIFISAGLLSEMELARFPHAREDDIGKSAQEGLLLPFWFLRDRDGRDWALIDSSLAKLAQSRSSNGQSSVREAFQPLWLLNGILGGFAAVDAPELHVPINAIALYLEAYRLGDELLRILEAPVGVNKLALRYRRNHSFANFINSEISRAKGDSFFMNDTKDIFFGGTDISRRSRSAQALSAITWWRFAQARRSVASLGRTGQLCQNFFASAAN
jgi:hypothetical protein